MIHWIYELLGKIGYSHPLHPAGVHLPIGLVMGGFIFSLLLVVLKRSELARTVRHVFILALIAVPPVALGGYMDWQHFYGGAPIFAIKAKIALATLLFLALAAALYHDFEGSRKVIILHGFCLVLVAGLGFFGGELVYGKKTEPAVIPSESADTAAKGQAVFKEYCIFCHDPASTRTLVGPGLAGLFSRKTLPTSHWPVTEANVRKQLLTPFGNMPTQDELSDEELGSIIDYMKTL